MIADRAVFDRGRDQMLSTANGLCIWRLELQRQLIARVIRFRAATGENNLARLASEQAATRSRARSMASRTWARSRSRSKDCRSTWSGTAAFPR